MRESGDPTLRARHQRIEDERYAELGEVSDYLQRSGWLRKGLSAAEARAVLWGLTGADWYCLLVFQRRWKPARYEEWLAQALVDLLLDPQKLAAASTARGMGQPPEQAESKSHATETLTRHIGPAG